MPNNPPSKSKTELGRWIAVVTVLSLAIVFGLGMESTDAILEKLGGSDLLRAVRALFQLWFLFTPAGGLAGILFAYLIFRDDRLTRFTLRLLRIGRWAPFFIWWVIAFQFTVEQPKPPTWLWIWIYGATMVALTAGYEYLTARFVHRISGKAALGPVARATILHGAFTAIFFEISEWSQISRAYPPTTLIGSALAITLVVTILLVNRAFGYTFARASAGRGTVLIEELKHHDWYTFWGASVLMLILLVSWQFLTGPVFQSAPIEVAVVLYQSVFDSEFHRYVLVSLKEIAIGMALSGGIAVFVIILLSHVSRLKTLTDGVMQALQVAPIAVLPDILGFLSFRNETWSIICVSVFCFHAFASAFHGLRSESIHRRIMMSLNEALPYAAAAVVYGEAMAATGGLSFMMVLAGATYQTARGLVGFFTLLFIVATVSTLIRWLGKRFGVKQD